METPSIVRYRYRWVVLFVFMLTMAIQQLVWINFASITSDSAKFYGVSELNIGMLSMVFMIVYIILSLPASWLIDTIGFRYATGLGVAITAIFSLLRGLYAYDYTLVLIFQIGIAMGQPLITNAVTKIAARWFPMKERATASGLSWLAGYLGLIAGLALTPFISEQYGIPMMLVYYGIASMAVAAAFIIFARERPPTPQCAPEQEERSLVLDGLKQIIRKKDFILLTVVFFIGLGIFNGLSTWIENILRPRGFSSTQAGIVGGVMIAAGVLGSGIVPILSDKLRNRTFFIFLAVAGSVPGLAGITFATNYTLLLVSAFVLGFFLLSTAPIAFQYGSEIAFPSPEGTSTGVLMLAGQVSGVIFIFGMDMFKSAQDGSMTVSMIVMTTLMLLGAVITTRLRESRMIRG